MESDDREEGEQPPGDYPERRLLVVLVDISGSMAKPYEDDDQDSRSGVAPIDELNEALIAFLEGVGDTSLGVDCEIGLAAFKKNNVVWPKIGEQVREGSKLHWARTAKPFVNPATGRPERLVADGKTPLGKAVAEACDVIKDRIAELETGHRFNPRPVLVILTDGKPTDDISAAIKKAHRLESDGRLAMWVAGTRHAEREYLESLADKGNFVDLGYKKLESFIQLMSLSIDVAGKYNSRTVEDIYSELLKKWESLDSEDL